jgi:predicted alpha/beta-hydrolase family hydrolase
MEGVHVSYEAEELRFLATEEKGEVSALLMRPAAARFLLVLGHGASTNMRHRTVETIAERCFDAGVATFRYNFPYSESGGGRNSNAVCQDTIRAAVAAAGGAAGDLRLLVGGHSFSGRMSSMAAAEEALVGVDGLVFFSFPLHPAGKPGTERADHLAEVGAPMLFLSGTRDGLGENELLIPVCEGLGSRATLHLLHTADHGFKTLKRSRNTDEDVYVEMARVLSEWTASLD